MLIASRGDCSVHVEAAGHRGSGLGRQVPTRGGPALRDLPTESQSARGSVAGRRLGRGGTAVPAAALQPEPNTTGSGRSHPRLAPSPEQRRMRRWPPQHRRDPR